MQDEEREATVCEREPQSGVCDRAPGCVVWRCALSPMLLPFVARALFLYLFYSHRFPWNRDYSCAILFMR